MAARTLNRPRRAASFGLSLIEILVGVAIGLIGIVSIFQAVAVWTKHTQSTSSGGDAQVAGTLALFNIERDLKLAGHGFGKAGTPVMGCLVSVTDSGPLGRAPFSFGLRPVEIVARPAARPTGSASSTAIRRSSSTRKSSTPPPPSSNKLQRRGGFKMGDLAVIAVNPAASAATAACQLIEITDDTDTDGYTVNHTVSRYSSYYNAASAPVVVPRFNNPASAPLASAGTMYNLGPQPILNTWSIESNRLLTKSELLQAQATPTAPMQIAEGVINMKAEYGYDTNGNGEIDDSPATRNGWPRCRPAPTGAVCSRSASPSSCAAASSSAAATRARAPSGP